MRSISIYDVASAIGVTPATISRWENGRRRIHPAFARILLLYFKGKLYSSGSHPRGLAPERER
jgi:transcriptional regulator with XRE-family HTH domain